MRAVSLFTLGLATLSMSACYVTPGELKMPTGYKYHNVEKPEVHGYDAAQQPQTQHDSTQSNNRMASYAQDEPNQTMQAAETVEIIESNIQVETTSVEVFVEAPVVEPAPTPVIVAPPAATPANNPAPETQTRISRRNMWQLDINDYKHGGY